MVRLLLFQRTGVQFPPITGWVTTICNLTSRESDALFSTPRAHSNARTLTHTHTNTQEIKKQLSAYNEHKNELLWSEVHHSLSSH